MPFNYYYRKCLWVSFSNTSVPVTLGENKAIRHSTEKRMEIWNPFFHSFPNGWSSLRSETAFKPVFLLTLIAFLRISMVLKHLREAFFDGANAYVHPTTRCNSCSGLCETHTRKTALVLSLFKKSVETENAVIPLVESRLLQKFVCSLCFTNLCLVLAQDCYTNLPSLYRSDFGTTEASTLKGLKPTACSSIHWYIIIGILANIGWPNIQKYTLNTFR